LTAALAAGRAVFRDQWLEAGNLAKLPRLDGGVAQSVRAAMVRQRSSISGRALREGAGEVLELRCKLSGSGLESLFGHGFALRRRAAL
jgi:hypothetical protein